MRRGSPSFADCLVRSRLPPHAPTLLVQTSREESVLLLLLLAHAESSAEAFASHKGSANAETHAKFRVLLRSVHRTPAHFQKIRGRSIHKSLNKRRERRSKTKSSRVLKHLPEAESMAE